MFFVPVVVVDLSSVEVLDHLGGAGAGFDGLEDTEGDEGPAVCIVQAVRVDDEGGRLPGDHSQVGWLPPSYAPYHCFENASSLLTGKNFDQTSVSRRALFTCLS